MGEKVRKLTKAELEKQIIGLEGRIEKLEAENKELRSRTVTREPAADEIRNMCAEYLRRCAKVNDLKRQTDVDEENLRLQIEIRGRKRERYVGAQTLYCVLFEPHEPYQSRFGDRRWTPWINYEIVSYEAMSRRPEWQEAVEWYTRSLTSSSGGELYRPGTAGYITSRDEKSIARQEVKNHDEGM